MTVYLAYLTYAVVLIWAAVVIAKRPGRSPWLDPAVVDRAVASAKIGSGCLALLAIVLGVAVAWQHNGDAGITGMVEPLIFGISLVGVWLLIVFLLERYRRYVHRHW